MNNKQYGKILAVFFVFIVIYLFNTQIFQFLWNLNTKDINIDGIDIPSLIQLAVFLYVELIPITVIVGIIVFAVSPSHYNSGLNRYQGKDGKIVTTSKAIILYSAITGIVLIIFNYIAKSFITNL